MHGDVLTPFALMAGILLLADNMKMYEQSILRMGGQQLVCK